jgi:hypothetical protein
MRSLRHPCPTQNQKGDISSPAVGGVSIKHQGETALGGLWSCVKPEGFKACHGHRPPIRERLEGRAAFRPAVAEIVIKRIHPCPSHIGIPGEVKGGIKTRGRVTAPLPPPGDVVPERVGELLAPRHIDESIPGGRKLS